MLDHVVTDLNHLGQNSLSMTEYYREKGYTEVRVDYRIDRDPSSGEGTITFVINEGQKLKIKVQLKKKQLLIRNKYVGELNLVPMSNTRFIDTESGTVIEFTIDEKVTGFIVDNGFRFIKL